MEMMLQYNKKEIYPSKTGRFFELHLSIFTKDSIIIVSKDKRL